MPIEANGSPIHRELVRTLSCFSTTSAKLMMVGFSVATITSKGVAGDAAIERSATRPSSWQPLYTGSPLQGEQKANMVT